MGHYVGSLRRRVELQNTGEFDDIFIMIADAQALTDNADNPEKDVYKRQNIYRSKRLCKSGARFAEHSPYCDCRSGHRYFDRDCYPFRLVSAKIRMFFKNNGLFLLFL